MPNSLTNIVVAGLGGQGVLTATNILADAILRAGFDVKTSEIKGMSQRGGSVMCDVRFGTKVLSPMIPPGEADYLVILEPTQVEPFHYLLKPGGMLLTPDQVDATRLPHRKSLNAALLGRLSTALPISEDAWREALRAGFPAAIFETNRAAFLVGREAQASLVPAP